MYEKPLILDELDLLYKGENNKLVIFYYQVIYWNNNNKASSLIQPTYLTLKSQPRSADEKEMLKLKSCKRTQKSITAMNHYIAKQNETDCNDKILFTTLCNKELLSGTAVYFMRSSLRKSLGEEAFQVIILFASIVSRHNHREKS